MNHHTKYEVEQIATLVGGTITKAVHSAGEDPGDDESFGFEVRLPNGKIVNVWVDCDPEGNGPGHLSLEPEKPVKPARKAR